MRHGNPDEIYGSARKELHDLCQPLTRLQWRLEIGQHLGHEMGVRDALNGALEDVRELIEKVHRLRQHLIATQPAIPKQEVR